MDKLEKVRKEIENIEEEYKGYCYDPHSGGIEEGVMLVCKRLLTLIDSMQEEPIDYNKLNTMLDKSLAKETKESWEEFLQEEPKKCMYANDNYTDEEMKGLCKDCDEECGYAKKEKYFDPLSLAHKWDKEFDELLEPYKDSRNYKNLYIRLRYWKQNCKREFLWKWKYKKDEHVSEELEEELNSYLERVKDTDKDIDFIDFAHHFANWQKQQMMKDATCVTVHIDAGNYPYIPQLELYDYDNDVALAKEGDKYKVVLIKEE